MRCRDEKEKPKEEDDEIQFIDEGSRGVQTMSITLYARPDQTMSITLFARRDYAWWWL